MKNRIKISKISNICLYTSNLEESANFYKNILGFIPTNSNPNLKNSDYYAFNLGEVVFALENKGLRKNDKKTKGENPYLLQFNIETIEELEEMNIWLEQNQVKIYDRSRKTDYGIITNFCDPDGNKLEFIFAT